MSIKLQLDVLAASVGGGAIYWTLTR